jgi:hypothetical protein
MAFLGGFVKVTLTKATLGTTQTKWVEAAQWLDGFKKDKYWSVNVTTQRLVTTKTPFQFTEFQAAVFGDFAKDMGGQFIPLAYPKPPEAASYQVDSQAGVENLRADFQ